MNSYKQGNKPRRGQKMKIVNLNGTSCTIRANNASMIGLLQAAQAEIVRNMQKASGLYLESLQRQDREVSEIISALENNC